MSRRVKGFRFAGVHGGVKANGALDMGMIAADQPAAGRAQVKRTAAKIGVAKVRVLPLHVGQSAVREPGSVKRSVRYHAGGEHRIGEVGVIELRSLHIGEFKVAILEPAAAE